MKRLRLKDLGTFKTGLTYSLDNICEPNEGVLVLRSANIQDDILDLGDCVYVNNDIPSWMRVKKGDILICSRNGSANLVGKTAIINSDINATWGAFMMLLRTRYNSNYINYLLNIIIRREKARFSTSTINQLTNSMLGGIVVDIFEDAKEQQRIVEYLDAKTTEIDKRIELLGKKRDAYKRLKIATINHAVIRGLDEHIKLKDSGIEWLGEIPAHWETRRIKDFFTNVSGNGFKVEFQGNEQGDYPFYKVSDLNGETKEVSHAKNYVTKSIAAQESYNIIPAHSILFPKIGEALKKNYRRINIDQCCVDNNCSALVIKDSHICLNYAYYIMRCIDMSWFDNGGTIPSVCISKLMSTSIPVPSFREQEFIVHYIDDRCAKIDEAVTIIDKQIDALKRLKRSLINEVVTGKRMV